MASIKTINTPAGTIYEVNGKAYKDKTKADAALAALNQQQENKQVQQAEQNLDRDLQFAEENQGKLYGEDVELGRLADDAGVQESLELLRDNVDMDSEEQRNPGDSTSFLVPQVEAPHSGWPIGSIGDYFGLPTVGQVTAGKSFFHSALPLRA